MNTSPLNHPPNAPDPLAVSLAKLDPAPHGFEWNALMFAAGRESKARALTFWRVTACACAVVAGGFALAFFARPPVVVERQNTVYVDRVLQVPADAPALAPAPHPLPEAKPDPIPAPASRPAPATGWTFDAPPEQGAAMRWLNLRNEVLTVGLGVLPDTGAKVTSPNRGER